MRSAVSILWTHLDGLSPRTQNKAVSPQLLGRRSAVGPSRQFALPGHTSEVGPSRTIDVLPS
jgi:hypothetical protein